MNAFKFDPWNALRRINKDIKTAEDKKKLDLSPCDIRRLMQYINGLNAAKNILEDEIKAQQPRNKVA